MVVPVSQVKRTFAFVMKEEHPIKGTAPFENVEEAETPTKSNFYSFLVINFKFLLFFFFLFFQTFSWCNIC